MSQYENKQRFLERHRRLGLCIWCSREAKTGMVLCQVCLARTSERRLARHPKFCPECKKLIKPEERHIGKKLHELCAQRRKARWSPLTHRRAAIAYQQRHKELGLCQNCSRKAFKWGRCRQHYSVAKERYDRAMRSV